MCVQSLEVKVVQRSGCLFDILCRVFGKMFPQGARHQLKVKGEAKG